MHPSLLFWGQLQIIMVYTRQIILVIRNTDEFMIFKPIFCQKRKPFFWKITTKIIRVNGNCIETAV